MSNGKAALTLDVSKKNERKPMALKKCKECGSDVSTEAESCPKCGAVIKVKTSPAAAFVAIILILVLFGAVYQFNQDVTNPTTKPSGGYAMPSVSKQIVTYDEYQRIQNGHTYSEVVEIIGASGEEISRNKIDGVQGVMPTTETIMYQWMNKNGSNMNAMFQNDSLIQKAQFGLR